TLIHIYSTFTSHVTQSHKERYFSFYQIYFFFQLKRKNFYFQKAFYITGYYSSCGSYNTILCKISSRSKPCAPYTFFFLQSFFFRFLSLDFFNRIKNPTKKMSQQPKVVSFQLKKNKCFFKKVGCLFWVGI